MLKKEKKENLRKNLLKKRSEVFAKKGDKSSKKIKNKLLNLKELKYSNNILAYVSYKSEVKTDELINDLLKMSKNIYAPYCIKEEKRMEIVKITDPENELKKGAYGIKEPKKSLRNNNANIKNLDLVLVPAVAFSKSGYRIGYGGGYYDRFLNRLDDKAISVGINYDELVLEELPKEDHDLAVNIVLSDKRNIRINN